MVVITNKIRCAVIGVGNCFAGLVQGIEYYRQHPEQEVIGVMHPVIGGYSIHDIEFVAGFDVAKNKIGKTINEAIYEAPNLVNWIEKNKMPKTNAQVYECPALDGIGLWVENKIRPINSKKSIEQLTAEIKHILNETRTEILVSYLPVGSEKVTKYWAQICLDCRIAFINCMPSFIGSDPEWAEKFKKANLPIVSDDVKGQVGATIVHRTLVRLCDDRGTRIEKTYQINVGGNSVTGDQMILFRVTGKIKYKKIGEFIDNLMKNCEPKKRKDGKEVLRRNEFPEKIECFTIDDNFKVKLVPIEAFIRHKISGSIFEIETEEGRKIEITEDHNLFILDETGKLKETSVRDLKIGETFIAVPENLFSSQKEERFINLRNYFEKIISDSPYRKGKLRIRNNFFEICGYPEIKIPTNFPLSDEFLQIVGIWLANGSYDKKGSGNIELTCGNNPDLVKVVKSFCNSFNLSYKIRDEKKVALSINSKILGRIFKTVFDLNGNVYTKRVPSWIFNLFERQIAQVLNGYVSVDGCITENQVRWSSPSEILIRDLQTLFLRIGINSTIFKEKYVMEKWKKAYPLRIGHCWHGFIRGYKNFKNFVERIGFIQKEKKEKALEIFRSKKESLKEKLIQNGEVKFVKVKSIRKIKTKTEEYVYDLSIKHFERFICSNILVHNTDFLNMKEQERLISKKISKTESVQSQLKQRLPDDKIYVGPSDFIPFLGNTKLMFMRIEGRMWANIPYNMEVRLEVDDKANSAGIVVDAIRACKVGLDRGIGGPLIGPSAYLMKRPIHQMSDAEARQEFENFIEGKNYRKY